MASPRDLLVDAIDFESFILCTGELEAKQLIGELMESFGIPRHTIVSLDFNGPGAHFRVRAYVNKPGDTYTWLRG